jgi:hypothetical protein
LHARTLRDRLSGGGAEAMEVQKQYRAAIAAYQDARSAHPNHYFAGWAYSQQLNCRRALATWDPRESVEAKRMLDAAPDYIASLPDDAFRAAPDDMSRQSMLAQFDWYSKNDGANN